MEGSGGGGEGEGNTISSIAIPQGWPRHGRACEEALISRAVLSLEALL